MRVILPVGAVSHSSQGYNRKYSTRGIFSHNSFTTERETIVAEGGNVDNFFFFKFHKEGRGLKDVAGRKYTGEPWKGVWPCG